MGGVSRNEFSSYRKMHFRLAWIQAEWAPSENNRKAKYYSLTKTGRKQLQAELEDWGRISTAIALVLK
jgi:PadR family transcriptional regulator PadR